MSGDIKIAWDDTLQEGDFFIDDNDLVSDEGIETAVIISLFTDRRAKDDDILPGNDVFAKRGWWGDLVSPEAENDEIGSRLWLLERSKTTQANINLAKEAVKEALQWLIDDQVAAAVDIQVERQGIEGNDRLAIAVQIKKIDGNIVAIRFDDKWNAQFEDI